ncbi:MAG: heavy-metal-associated domain-containing protein [Bacteroidales bacterium]|nr:heavy-metal-associated domain-containing protein [Bacteroidales bacterium]
MMTSLLLLAGGKDLRELVLTPTPQMHCANCENKIKNNMRFEKGVVKIETSVEKQTVVITYNGAKTDAKALQAAMKKIGYDTQIVSDKPVGKREKNKK